MDTAYQERDKQKISEQDICKHNTTCPSALHVIPQAHVATNSDKVCEAQHHDRQGSRLGRKMLLGRKDSAALFVSNSVENTNSGYHVSNS